MSQKQQVAYINRENGLIEQERAHSSFYSFLLMCLQKFKREVRPLSNGAILPADGFYRFFETVEKRDTFTLNSTSFSLSTLFDNEALATMYEGGSLLLARLYPGNSSRFYFPFDCTPGKPWPLDATRTLTFVHSPEYGRVAFFEIGATQTFEPVKPYQKGDEKSYFTRNDAALLLLFEKGKIVFEKDLLAAMQQDLEIRCRIGDALGKPSRKNLFAITP